MLAPVGFLIAAFAIGSLPFGLWIGRAARGIDVRRHGSGNPGAANVFRVVGPGWGMLTLVLDVAKGWVGAALLPGPLGLGTAGQGALWPLAGAAAAVAGHVASPWIGFRGGKGVATALGGFLALSPVAAGLAIAGFLASLLLTRYVSVSSMTLALVFPAAAALLGPPPPLRLWVVALGALLAALVGWRHRANWRRIRQGKETRFSWGTNRTRRT